MAYAAPLPRPVPTHVVGFYGDSGQSTESQHDFGGRYDLEPLTREEALAADFQLLDDLGGQYDVEQIKQEEALAASFQLLIDEWLENIAYVSSITEMVSDPAYLKIIGMGRQALPYLIRELERAPNHWFAALAAITGENPVEDHQRGNLLEMTRVWLEWASREGFD